MSRNDKNEEKEIKTGYNPETWLQDIYDAVPCGIMRFHVCNNQQTLLSANRTALAMSGVPSMEMLAAIVKKGFFASSDAADGNLDYYYRELVNVGDTMMIEKCFLSSNLALCLVFSKTSDSSNS